MTPASFDINTLTSFAEAAAKAMASEATGAPTRQRKATHGSGRTGPPPMASGTGMFGDLFAGPSPPMPKVDVAQLTALVQKLQLSTLDKQITSGEGDAQTDKKRMKESSDSKVKSMKKAQEEADKKATSSLVMKIFGWIASVLAIVVSVVIAVVSFGGGSALVGMAALASAAVTIAVSTMQETGAMGKLTQAVAKSLADGLSGSSMDKGTRNLIGQIMAQVMISAIIITTQIALSAFSGGAGAASTISSQVAKVAAQVAIKGGMIATAAFGAAGAAAQAAVGAFGFTQGNARANIELNAAQMLRLQAIMEANQEALEDAVQKLQDTFTGVSDMLRDHSEANLQVLGNIARQSV